MACPIYHTTFIMHSNKRSLGVGMGGRHVSSINLNYWIWDLMQLYPGLYSWWVLSKYLISRHVFLKSKSIFHFYGGIVNGRYVSREAVCWQRVLICQLEVCSAHPTSGGPYFWAAMLSKPKDAPLASWITGPFCFVSHRHDSLTFWNRLVCCLLFLPFSDSLTPLQGSICWGKLQWQLA